MKYDRIKQLKQEIKELKEENDFLQRGINSREEAHDYVCKQRDRAMALTQEISFLLLYMEAVERLLEDCRTNANAMTIQLAINKFRAEITRGFGDNHLYNKLDNNTTHEETQ